MKVYWIDGDRRQNYAWFSHEGTWSEGELCKKCGLHTQRLIEPLQLKWSIGNDEIGDFSWCSYVFVVLDRVIDFMSTHGYDFRVGHVDVTGSESKQGYRSVPFPYTGPNLNWVMANARVPLNEIESSVVIDIDCDLCGQKRYTFKRDGIIINHADWFGQKMFRITQFGKSKATLVTEKSREELLEQGFSNVDFLEAGEIT